MQSARTEGSKPFKRGKDTQRDLASLTTSYLLQRDPELKSLIALLVRIHRDDSEDQLAAIVEISAEFCVSLVRFAAAAEGDEAKGAIRQFHETLRRIEQHNSLPANQEDLMKVVSKTIEALKSEYPSLNTPSPDHQSEYDSDFFEILNWLLEIGLVHLVPFFEETIARKFGVLWLKGILVGVSILRTALRRTPFNRNRMQDLVYTASDFALNLAESCSSVRLPTDVERLVKRFEKMLADIAKECLAMSHENLWSCLRNGRQATRLEALRQQLNDAVQQFQNSNLLEIHVSLEHIKEQNDSNLLEIHVSLEHIKQQNDYAVLKSLPSHPSTLTTRGAYPCTSRADCMETICSWIEDPREAAR